MALPESGEWGLPQPPGSYTYAGVLWVLRDLWGFPEQKANAGSSPKTKKILLTIDFSYKIIIRFK